MAVKFFRIVLRMVWHLRGVYLAQLALIIVGAVTIAETEKLPIGDALYFAFITGLTIGYGDIVAHSAAGRVVSVLLGIVGVFFTGLMVAVAVHALRDAWDQTQHPD